MRATRFSRWQRRAGVVAFVAAGAILLASCSSGPTGVRSPGPPAKAPSSTAAVKTVQFPSGPVAEHIYGPSWARFVAAFPGKVVVGSAPGFSACTTGTSQPSYDATAGTPLTPNVTPPSYNVLVFRCRSASVATRFLHAISLHTSAVTVDGERGLALALGNYPYGPHKLPDWSAADIFRMANVVYVDEVNSSSPASTRDFIGSFHFDTSGYTPAR